MPFLNENKLTVDVQLHNYGIANQTMNMSPTATKLVPVGSNSVQLQKLFY